MDTKEKVVKENNKKVIFRIVAVLVILILIIAMGGMMIAMSTKEEVPVKVMIEEQIVEKQSVENIMVKAEVEEPKEQGEVLEEGEQPKEDNKLEEELKADEDSTSEEGIEKNEESKPAKSTEQEEEQKQLPVIEEVTYVQGEKVVLWLDAGHGGRDVGSDVRSIYEKDINIIVVNKIVKELENDGYEILLTRSDDSTVRLYDRVDMINAAKPHLMVSVHCNSMTEEYINGVEVHYASGKCVGESLAQCLQSSIVANTGTKDRGKKGGELAVVKYTTMPAALIEMGYLTNDADYGNLINPEYQDKMAKGIADGIRTFINEKLGK